MECDVWDYRFYGKGKPSNHTSRFTLPAYFGKKMNNIPYFQIYAVDFLTLTQKLSEKEIFLILTAVSEICLYGKTEIKIENFYTKIFYEKILKDLEKNKKKYLASVRNGRKGGRPPDNPQVSTGLSETEPKHNLGAKQQKQKQKHNKKQKIIKEKINKKEFGEFKNVLLSDEEYQKLFNLYFDKLDEALETLSVWKNNKNKKTTHNYGSLLKSQWVYKKVMEERSGNIRNENKDTIQSNDDVFRKILNKQEGLND
jgi:hypothetical protein